MVGIEEGEADEVGDLAGVPHVSRRGDVEDQHVPEVDKKRESADRGEERSDVELAAKAITDSKKVLEVKASEGGERES